MPSFLNVGLFLVLIVKLEIKLLALSVIVLNHHDKAVRVRRCRGVVQTEVIRQQRIAVVDKQLTPVVFQRTLAVIVKPADGVLRVTRPALASSEQRISTVSPCVTLRGTGIVSTWNG